MAIRLPPSLNRSLGRLIGGIRLRIRHGPNRGMWWSIASAGRGYLSGRFEARRIDALVALLRRGDRFWDVGAHKGYVTLAASRIVGAEGQVIAFEPAEVNRAFLGKHVAWNRLENVQIVPVALSDSDGEARLGGSGSSLALRLGSGDTLVPTRTLDSLIYQYDLDPPRVLKIDAEHSEAAVLRGARKSLSQIGMVWISLHSRALYAECRDLLRAHGLDVFESGSLRERIADPSVPWGADQELLGVRPDAGLSERRLRELDLFAA